MSIFAGIDLGTSGIKVALIDEDGMCLASAARPCPVDRPHAGWSQQDPELWWTTTTQIFDRLADENPVLMARLKGVSLSGQMLGPVLLDQSDRPVTPCILWNDQRALVECDELLAKIPDIGSRTNGQPDPGLGAPKLLWLAKHRAAELQRADTLMLPKDYVRLKLTGERGTDISDASGTMLMDCAAGAWDDALLAAANWDRDRLPALFLSYAPAGQLLPSLCQRWNTPDQVIVGAGCGDNYAGSLGVGASRAGDAALSIGTSGVLSAVDNQFRPLPQHAVLTTPHAAPDTFLSMGVVMSATQSLDWLATLTNTAAAELASAAEQRISKHGIGQQPIARPSLTGVRTPDNRPDAGAAFAAITAVTDKVDLAYTVMEGVAFQFYDAFLAQTNAGVPIERLTAVGGGTRSKLWLQLIATLLDRPLNIPEFGDISACIGAAKLGQIAAGYGDVDPVLARPQPTRTCIDPTKALTENLPERHASYRTLPFF